jgi:hypothetical protein
MPNENSPLKIGNCIVGIIISRKPPDIKMGLQMVKKWSETIM